MEFFVAFQHHVDPAIGVYIIDRYTYYALDFLEQVHPSNPKKLSELVRLFFQNAQRCFKIIFTH